MADPVDKSREINPFWHPMLSGEFQTMRRGRQLFHLLSPTAQDRCRICLAGFDGFTAPLMRALRRAPWHRNSHFCEKCEEILRAHRGGTEIDIAVLYADVRGSTQMASGMRPAEFAALMQRFFQAAAKIFLRSDAVVDKMMGDEVIGIYVPGLAGPDFGQRAVEAGLDLLRATGHGERGDPWLPIGVGVHTGVAFVGSIGVEGGAYEFAALGDTMNLGARLVASAKAGEMIMSEAAWKDVSGKVSAEPRSLKLKGYAEPVKAYAARVDAQL
jgi:adenylate cyclase